jgi:hypothetical protein
MGTRGPVEWPPISPDLTPLDFFLWEHLKTVVYSNPPNDLQDLKNKIIVACAQLTEEQILSATHREALQRCEVCVAHHGNNFEQFLR